MKDVIITILREQDRELGEFALGLTVHEQQRWDLFSLTLKVVEYLLLLQCENTLTKP
jgi:hypothetical protein